MTTTNLPSVFINGNAGVGTAPLDDDRVKLYVYNGAEMTCVILKVVGDDEDINIDGAAWVKHAKDYTATPGYANTDQFYGEAGVVALILGCNTYVGLDRSVPYAPTVDAVPSGSICFELGPLAPYSEKARFNNRGDLIIAWTLLRKIPVAAQSGDIVTGSGFVAGDVGKFVCWSDYELRGKFRPADRITEFISATQVRVETPRTIADQAARVCSPRTILRYDGGLEMKNQPTPTVTRDDAGVLFVQDGALKFRGAAGTVTTIAPA